MSSAVALARRPLTASFASSAVIQGLNALTGILLARALGPEVRGELAAILLWPGLLVAVGSLGLYDALAFHTARGSAPIRSIIGTASALWAVQTVALLGIGALVVPLVLGRHGSDVVRLGFLYLTYMPFFLVASYAMSILQGLKRFSAYQALRVGLIVLVAIGLITLAAADRIGVTTAVGLYVASYVLIALAAVSLLYSSSPSRPRVDVRLGRRLLSYSVRSHASNVSILLNERLDQLLISLILAPTQLGLYAVAVTLTSLPGMVAQSVSAIALPTIAAAQEENERRLAARRYIGITLLGATSLVIPLLVLTPAIVDLLFGRVFLPVVIPARVLLVAAVILATTRVAQSVQKALGKPLDAGRSELLALGVTAVALVALLPWLGILGAALASLAAYSASAAWTFSRIRSDIELVRPPAVLAPVLNVDGDAVGDG